MILFLVLLGITAGVLLAGFFSGLETALYSASRIRLQRCAQDGDRRAELCLRLAADLPAVVTITLIGHNLSVHLATFLLTHAVERAGAGLNPEALATLLLTPPCFLFAELLPKRLGYARAEAFAKAGVRVCRVAGSCFLPLAWMLSGLGRGLHHLLRRGGGGGCGAGGREGLLEHLEVGAAERVLSPAQYRMLERIIAIRDLHVGEVMFPASRVLSVRENESCMAAARAMHAAGVRRAPLVDRGGRLTGRQVSLDRILASPGSREQPVSSLATEMPLLDANTQASRALQRLREESTRLALVTGKGGAPLGVITASALLQRVVGTLRL